MVIILSLNLFLAPSDYVGMANSHPQDRVELTAAGMTTETGGIRTRHGLKALLHKPVTQLQQQLALRIVQSNRHDELNIDNCDSVTALLVLTGSKILIYTWNLMSISDRKATSQTADLQAPLPPAWCLHTLR